MGKLGQFKSRGYPSGSLEEVATEGLDKTMQGVVYLTQNKSSGYAIRASTVKRRHAV